MRTVNDDDYAVGKDYLLLELPADALVYVCYWAAASGLPGWLREEGWARLEVPARVHIGGADKDYRVFARRAAKGCLTLGGNERERTGAVSMYFVVSQPAPAASPPTQGNAR